MGYRDPEGHWHNIPFEPGEPLVCFVRTNWGTAAIPANKVDYVDSFKFVGGAAWDIPASLAIRWQGHGIGGLALSNNVTREDIALALGRTAQDSSTPATSAIWHEDDQGMHLVWYNELLIS